MKHGDVLLLMDGRIAQLLSDPYGAVGGMTAIQFIDRDEESYIDFDNLDVEENLGKSFGILANFHAARSIHLRLNRMAKV